MIGRITKVRKRDGRLVDFDESKIADAIYKAACAVGGEDRFLSEELSGVVTLFLEKRYPGRVPQIEEIQDMVEKVLIETGHASTAKAYSLDRDRRARARDRVTVHAEGGGGAPLVGNPLRAVVTPWSKRRVQEALVREADLDEHVAAEVAARVEAKIFESSPERVATSQIRSLVEAELFLMGYSESVARQALVGLPRFDIDRLLRGHKECGWRPTGPQDLKRTVAETVLTQYALAEVYSAEVVNAHLDARIHVYDAGCPFEWIAAAGRIGTAADPDAWVETAALSAGRLSEVVTREVCLDVCPADGPAWLEPVTPSSVARAAAAGSLNDGAPESENRVSESQLRGERALQAARRLLAHPVLRTIDPRGGRFRICLRVPLVANDETRLAESLVREHWALFRDGGMRSLPRLLIQATPEQLADDKNRSAVLLLLAAASETGRIRIAFDRSDGARSTSAYRLSSAEAAEELRTAGEAAVGFCGFVAVNVLDVAAGFDRLDEPALFEALEHRVGLALKALRQKRSFVAALAADPSGPLYRIAAGARPRIAGGSGLDLLHLSGVRAAAELLADGEDALRLAGRIRSYVSLWAMEEARKMRLKVIPGSDRAGEALRRFLDAGRIRNRRIARAFPPESELPGDSDRYCSATLQSAGLAAAEGWLDASSATLGLRFPRETAPGPEALYDALEVLARDLRVGAVEFAPWPDRYVRAADKPRPI